MARTANGGWHCCQPPLSQLPPPPGRVAAPAGWVGSRPKRASCRSPVGALRAEARGEPFGVSHQTFRPGLDPFRRPVGAGAHPVSGGSSRGPKPPSRFRSAQVLGRTPPPSPSASDRSEPRSSAFRPRIEASPDLRPFGIRPKQASIFRREHRRGEPPSLPASLSPRSKPLGFRWQLPIEASSDPPPPAPASRNPLSPAGPSARRTPLPIRSSPVPKQAPASGSSAFASAGRFPLRFRRLQLLGRGFRRCRAAFEIRPRIRFRLCWPGFFHRPASGVQALPFEGKELSAFGGFRSGSVPFPGPDPFRPRHENCHGIRVAPSGFSLWITRITGVSF